MDQPAEHRPAVNLAELRNRWELASGREQRFEKSLSEVRLEKGKILIAARGAFPARGPKAKGWGDLLQAWKVEQRTAWNYMELAGYVAVVSESVSETSHVPTHAEAGMKPGGTTDAPREPSSVPTAVAAPAELDPTPGRGPAEGSTAAEVARGVVDAVNADLPSYAHRADGSVDMSPFSEPTVELDTTPSDGAPVVQTVQSMVATSRALLSQAERLDAFAQSGARISMHPHAREGLRVGLIAAKTSIEKALRTMGWE